MSQLAAGDLLLHPLAGGMRGDNPIDLSEVIEPLERGLGGFEKGRSIYYCFTSRTSSQS